MPMKHPLNWYRNDPTNLALNSGNCLMAGLTTVRSTKSTIR